MSNHLFFVIIWSSYLYFALILCSDLAGNRIGFYPGIGESMEPSLPRGITWSLYVPPRNIEVGDIIVFEDGGVNVEHRVVEITDSGNYITQGDNNNAQDSVVEPWQVKGKCLQFNDQPIYIPTSYQSIKRTWKKFS